MHWLASRSLPLGIVICSIFLLVGSLTVGMLSPVSGQSDEAALASCPSVPPPRSFAMRPESYEQVSSSAFALRSSEICLQLPDLRSELLILGRNQRPDADAERPTIHVMLKNCKEVRSLHFLEKVYLDYQEGKGSEPGGYVFSKDNVPTFLWIEPEMHDSNLCVQVGMMDENGKMVTKPEELARLVANKESNASAPALPWELDGQKVDSSLLARQHARWVGIDSFLQHHGGKEYAFLAPKQRIDFAEGEKGYSCYLEEGGCLVWKDGRWHTVLPEMDTRAYPLLQAKKMDDRLLHCTLWDQEGKAKVSLTLVKAADPPFSSQSLQKNYKFLGSKTWRHFLIEMDNQRLLLQPEDWVIRHEDQWVRISSAEEVDLYVAREWTGPLFVLDQVVVKEGQQVALAHLFNSARTEIVSLELPLQTSTASETTASAVTPPRPTRPATPRPPIQPAPPAAFTIPPPAAPSATLTPSPAATLTAKQQEEQENIEDQLMIENAP